MIKAMAAPYTQMKFMPTGGITQRTSIPTWAFDKVLACWRKLDGGKKIWLQPEIQ